MRPIHRALVLVVLVTSVSSLGCFRGARGASSVLNLVTASIELAGAIASLSQHSARSSGSSNPDLNEPLDRSMTRCELERSRWREAHQDEDEIPPEKDCSSDGSYLFVSEAAAAASAPSRPVAVPQATEPEAPCAPEAERPSEPPAEPPTEI